MIYDVCIIGGGAAGLAAAASFHKDMKICILEKNRLPGRKILATGGGRCNLTNKACENRDAVLDMFRNLGLETRKDEEGRYYPYSNRASDVVKTLVESLGKNTELICGNTVKDIEKGSEEFIITVCEENGTHRAVRASKVIIASGGKAAPQYGTTGDGYAFAKSLGHSISRVYPILAGIECSRPGTDFADLKGIRAMGKVTLLKNGRPVQEETGEIQFTEDGISGICVFNLTPNIKADEGENPKKAMGKYKVCIDFAPDFLQEDLAARNSSFGIVTEKLSEAVDIKEIKCWELQVTGVKGWRHAQATCGGVPVSEVNMETMESLIVPGLYFAGEILDIQGPCGGFNLQNAWETGMKAAQAIGKGRK